MSRLYLFLIGLLFIIGELNSQTSISSEDILKKAVAVLNNSNGIQANFIVTGNGYNNKGTIKAKGKNFYIALPDINIWYNGKDMYSYNENTEETTVVVPSQEEINETNPLHYISNAANLYNVAFSTIKKSEFYVLELTPKNKNNQVKRITLTLRKNNYQPERLVVEPKTGAPVRADITSFQRGQNIIATDFEYPKSKFPKAEIIDLR